MSRQKGATSFIQPGGLGRLTGKAMPDLVFKKRTRMWERSKIVSMKRGWVAREAERWGRVNRQIGKRSGNTMWR